MVYRKQIIVLSHGIFNQQAPIKVASTGWTVNKWHVMTFMARLLQPSFSQMNCHPSQLSPQKDRSPLNPQVIGYSRSPDPQIVTVLFHPASWLVLPIPIFGLGILQDIPKMWASQTIAKLVHITPKTMATITLITTVFMGFMNQLTVFTPMVYKCIIPYNVPMDNTMEK